MALVGHISGSTQSNSIIGISGSVIIANKPNTTFPALPGSDVKFFVEQLSLFGSEGIVSSGSLVTKGSGGASTFSVVASSGNTTVGGTLATIGASTLASLGVTGAATVGTTLGVTGASTLASLGVTGAATVGTTLGVTGASTLASLGVTGAATVGTTLGVTGASTLASLAVTGNTILSGDLTVNGAMVTVNTTNLEVKDSVIGFGFASGTLQQAAGDRGWIGGLAGTNNVMSKWDNTAAEFAFATTTSSATGSFAITAYSNLHAANIIGSIVSASLGFSGSHTRLMDGTSYIIAGSGMTVTSASNGAITLSAAGGGGGDVTGPGSSTANAVALFDGVTGKIIKNSGLTTDGSNSLFIGGTLGVSGSTTFGASVLPSADSSYDLGSPSFRWANVYTGDLHLRNDRGDYTLIEEENFLTVRFNKTGKRYKFLLESTPEFDEDPTLNF